MNEETARYLASYLKENEDSYMEWHNGFDGGYESINVNLLAATILKFFEELP